MDDVVPTVVDTKQGVRIEVKDYQEPPPVEEPYESEPMRGKRLGYEVVVYLDDDAEIMTLKGTAVQAISPASTLATSK